MKTLAVLVHKQRPFNVISELSNNVPNQRLSEYQWLPVFCFRHGKQSISIKVTVAFFSFCLMVAALLALTFWPQRKQDFNPAVGYRKAKSF